MKIGIRKAYAILFAIVWCFIISLFCYVNGIMADKEPPKCLQWMYDFLSKNIYAKWTTVLSIIVFAWIIIVRVCKDFAYPFLQFVLFLTIIFALIIFNAWDYIPIFSVYDYRWFCITISVALISVITTRIIIIFHYRKKKNKGIQKGQTDKHAFHITIPPTQEVETEWNDYIEAIVKRLGEADVTQEAFAMGITGEWGTGKTHFLGKVRERFKDNKEYVCVDFNPWKCADDKQIVDSFFETIKQQLSPIYSPLGNILEHYSRMLIDADMNTKLSLYSRLYLLLSKATAVELEKKISESLDHTGKKIVVFIDDLDRLDGKEMFSVMKLVRNTASFKNMLYVVAYDKNYVTATLESASISNASEYMRKIFPLEITLPALPLHFIPELLEKCLTLYMPVGCTETINKLDRAIYTTLQGQYAVTSFLKSQRDVVNFSMQYVAVASPLIEDKSKSKDISAVELFWLELIHYANNTLYEMLKNADETLLLKEKHLPQNVYEYRINTQSDVYKNLVVSQQEVLLLLFPGKNNNKTFYNSVRSVDNHYKYFSFHISDSDILSTEYLGVIRGKIDINDWLDKRTQQKGIPVAKILFYSDIIKTETLGFEDACRYIDLFIVCILRAWNSRIPDIFSRKLYLNAYYRTKFKEYLHSKLLSAIDGASPDDLIHLQKVLSELCNIANYYEQHPDGQEPLLDYTAISAIEDSLWQRFDSQLPITNPKQLVQEGRVKELLKSSVVVNQIYQEIEIKFSLLMNKVTEKLSVIHLSKIEYQNFIKYFRPDIDEDLAYTETDYLESLKSCCSDDITTLFGDISTFKSFLTSCFDVSEEVVKNDFKLINA